ncbi:MAG: sugar ABC transporter substrate-binding protein [Firmicutes bacterium]|nr:sugar ABC transporter substrate-binding protein [Bacillota bacterium]
MFKKVLYMALVVCLLISGLAITAMAAEKTTLQFWVSAATPESSKWYREEVFPAFEKKYPHLKVEYQEMGWGIQRTQKLTAAYAAGAAPDVYEAGSEHILDMYLRGEIYQGFDKYLSAWDGRDKVFPYAWHSNTWAGKHFGIPMYTEIRALFYRKSFFKDAGLDPEMGPQTWEQLKDYAEKLTVREGRRLIRAGYDFSRLQGLAGVQEFMTFLWQNGGDYFDEDRNIMIDSPEGMETLRFLADLYQAVYPTGTAPLPSGTIPNFPAGKLAMAHGPWNIFQMIIYNPQELDDVGITIPPVGRKKKVVSTYTNWLTISSQSKHPDEAWKLIEFVATAERMGTLAAHLNAVPAREDAVDVVINKYPVINDLAILGEEYGEPNRIYPEFEYLNTVLGDNIDAACMGQKTPEEAMKDVGDKWRKNLTGARWE